jgi:predicted double-glycine peptidase
MVADHRVLLSALKARGRYFTLQIIFLVGLALVPGKPRADPHVLLPVPNVRQFTAYACGAAALQAILAYYGVDVRQDTLIQQLGTNESDGTRYWEIVRVAEEYGLRPTVVSGFTTTDLIAEINKGVPVLIAIQGWIEEGNPRDIAAWLARKDDGHYLVAIGYDDHRIYFEDPAMFHIGYIDFEELDARWHDYDQNGRRLDHFAILFTGGSHAAITTPSYVPVD